MLVSPTTSNVTASNPTLAHWILGTHLFHWSALGPPRPVIGVDQVIAMLAASTTTLAASRSTHAQRKAGQPSRRRTGATSTTAPRPLAHAITWHARSRF